MSHPRNELYGIGVKEIAEVCGVDLSTARRWKRGASCPPKSALMLLSGDLGILDKEWRGWVIRRGVLISPEGWDAKPGEVLALPLMRAQIHSYQLESRKRRRVDDAWAEKEQQPLPTAWPINVK